MTSGYTSSTLSATICRARRRGASVPWSPPRSCTTSRTQRTTKRLLWLRFHCAALVEPSLRRRRRRRRHRQHATRQTQRRGGSSQRQPNLRAAGEWPRQRRHLRKPRQIRQGDRPRRAALRRSGRQRSLRRSLRHVPPRSAAAVSEAWQRRENSPHGHRPSTVTV